MNKRILRIAIPYILSNITVPLVGLVDVALLGRLESEVYIGAVSLGALLFNTIYWAFGFLRMGTGGLTAQAFGARDFTESLATLGRALIIGFLGGILIVALQYPVAWLGFYLLEGSAEVEQLAKSYFYIRIWAAPATISLFALTGWYIGMQNARTPLIITLTITLLNIVFNIYFVQFRGMTSNGVAYGTLIAQYGGFFVGLLMLLRYKRLWKYWIRHILWNWLALKRFFAINSDFFIRTLCPIFIFAFFTAQSAKNGDMILAVNTLLLQFFMFYIHFVDGFATAGEALVGKYVGAKNPDALRQSIRYMFYWGIGTTVLISLVFILFKHPLLRLLTTNNDLIQATLPYAFWMVLMPMLSVFGFMWDGAYMGATASKAMRNTMIIATIAVFLPAYYLSESLLDNHSLWLAFGLFFLARGVSQTVIARRVIYQRF